MHADSNPAPQYHFFRPDSTAPKVERDTLQSHPDCLSRALSEYESLGRHEKGRAVNNMAANDSNQKVYWNGHWKPTECVACNISSYTLKLTILLDCHKLVVCMRIIWIFDPLCLDKAEDLQHVRFDAAPYLLSFTFSHLQYTYKAMSSIKRCFFIRRDTKDTDLRAFWSTGAGRTVAGSGSQCKRM